MAIPKLLEAKIQKIVKSFGAPVPEIIMEFSEADEIGEGYIMEAVTGETIPRKILKNDNYEYIRDKLPFEIGRSLAQIHQTELDRLQELEQVSFEESLNKAHSREEITSGSMIITRHAPAAAAPARPLGPVSLVDCGRKRHTPSSRHGHFRGLGTSRSGERAT